MTNPRQVRGRGPEQHGSVLDPLTTFARFHQLFDGHDALARYRAAHLIQTFGLQPEIAWALSAVAFGGAA